jgi:hypothetical protein
MPFILVTIDVLLKMIDYCHEASLVGVYKLKLMHFVSDQQEFHSVAQLYGENLEAREPTVH